MHGNADGELRSIRHVNVEWILRQWSTLTMIDTRPLTGGLASSHSFEGPWLDWVHEIQESIDVLDEPGILTSSNASLDEILYQLDGIKY
ncbi:hypothetical protein J6590_079234 [Homalodisca vitripennis]|nr:hypothetical protein J6590_100166 [Homalodisca vitripennis]KAG8295489.1 hypothetical protein J6590_079234 [Homalodisca vitripennis]